MRIRIFYEDTDTGGIVYHANYIKFCERARSEMMFEAGVKFSPARHFVVADIKAKFLKPAVLGDILEVKTRLLNASGARVVLEQNIYKIGGLYAISVATAGAAAASDGDMVFASQITLAYIADNRPARVPDDVKSVFGTNASGL